MTSLVREGQASRWCSAGPKIVEQILIFKAKLFQLVSEQLKVQVDSML
jgi:hypothetical protein